MKEFGSYCLSEERGQPLGQADSNLRENPGTLFLLPLLQTPSTHVGPPLCSSTYSQMIPGFQGPVLTLTTLSYLLNMKIVKIASPVIGEI